jgi:hypothetical protein
MPSLKTLTGAAALLVVSLTPSVTDCLKAHSEDAPPSHRIIIWAWVALAVVVSILFAEAFLGVK